MKTVVPDYYKDFKCIAGNCAHTCCEGWEIEVDEESLERFGKIPEISGHLSDEGGAHIVLEEGERCPFLRTDGLCSMILDYGEDMLCGICRDHPRFRNYFSDRVEMGLGLVCEEAGRLILSRKTPMKLVTVEDDGAEEKLPDDEKYLLDLRDGMLESITEEGPTARLLEYLIYRHLPDALYDGLLEERCAFIKRAFDVITGSWSGTGGTIEELAECARKFSYDVEYDDEVLDKYIKG